MLTREAPDLATAASAATPPARAPRAKFTDGKDNHP